MDRIDVNSLKDTTLTYLSKPSFMLRFVEFFMAMIIFACIAGNLRPERDNDDYCVLNKDSAVCSYGIGIGVLGWLLTIAFMAFAVFADSLSGLHQPLALIEAALSLTWSFLFFILFCWATDAWRKTTDNLTPAQHSNANSVIFFSFFSILAWGYSTLLAWRSYQDPEDMGYSWDNQYQRADTGGDFNPPPFGQSSGGGYQTGV
eukprot:Clim_evm61s146 gene=Clim_evmTU61s146